MEIDYEKIGFKAGLEIHQQIEGHKLFCDCPTLNLNKEKPDIRIERRLRAVAGETGEIDAAALHEMQKAKKFIYESSSEDTCLVEYDEELAFKWVMERGMHEVLSLKVGPLKAALKKQADTPSQLMIDGKPVANFLKIHSARIDGDLSSFLEVSDG